MTLKKNDGSLEKVKLDSYSLGIRSILEERQGLSLKTRQKPS